MTTGLSSAMMLTVRKAFPGATLVNDRFHVQQPMSEAVDQLRIRHRWEVLEAENKAIKEHRERRRAARTREEREEVGLWEPERMANGETLPQVMARSRHVILRHESKWSGRQRPRAEILFERFPDLATACSLSIKLVDIFNRRSTAAAARLSLARWYNEVEAFGEKEFNRVLETFENHSRTIINYFERRLTNASAVKGSQPVYEEFDVPDPSKLGAERLYLGVELYSCLFRPPGKPANPVQPHPCSLMLIKKASRICNNS